MCAGGSDARNPRLDTVGSFVDGRVDVAREWSVRSATTVNCEQTSPSRIQTQKTALIDAARPFVATGCNDSLWQHVYHRARLLDRDSSGHGDHGYSM